ncbi:MAG TPA: DUF2125 domain-containing protein [Aliidongia sp.]|nr:DUF2125 domain-containing protein [Aliidongia sp.]
MLQRRSVFRFAGLALLLAGLYCVLWLYEASRIRAGLADFIAARAAKGMIVKTGAPEIGGFPLRIEAQFGGVSVDGLPYLPSAHLTAPVLIARARPWLPDTWRFEAPQGLSLELPQQGATAAVGSTKGRAVLVRGDAGSVTIEVDAHDISATMAGGEPVTAHHLELRFETPNRPAEDHSAESLGVSLLADDAVLPSGIGPLGAKIEELSIDAAVEGPIAEAAPMQALTAWRDRGGTIELHRVHIRYGTLRLDGNGTIALDQTLQPVGAFSAEMHGWQAALDAFAAGGVLTQAEANYVRTGLTLLARKSEDGDERFSTSITLQNRLLYLGPARIAKLPTIAW